MVWLPILLFTILLIVGYLLFAPFYLEISSIHSLCRLRFHRIASARLFFAGNELKIDLRITGWRKQIDLPGKRRKKSLPEKTAPKNSWFPIKKMRAIIKTFKINTCYINIDTGDAGLNGMLYPGFYWLSAYIHKPVGINFLNENDIVLEIENSLARMAWAYIFH